MAVVASMRHAPRAARRDVADRCAALNRSLAQGRGVVADLRGTLERRDAEVILLGDQIKADRLLLERSPAVNLFPWASGRAEEPCGADP